MSITTYKNPEQVKKALETKATRLTPKQKAFAEEYVKRQNGTQSALKVYDTTDINTAGMIASDNLSKPKIRMEILSLLEQNNIKLGEVFTTHKRNMLQTESLPTSQKAVSDFYNILGMTNNDKPTSSTNIAFVIDTTQ